MQSVLSFFSALCAKIKSSFLSHDIFSLSDYTSPRCVGLLLFLLYYILHFATSEKPPCTLFPENAVDFRCAIAYNLDKKKSQSS